MEPVRRWRVVCLCFRHPHMAAYLRSALRHPQVDVVGICDEQGERLAAAAATHAIPAAAVFGDWRRCLEATRPDLAILCPPTAEHALWVERIAPFGVHILLGKPFAASLADADRILDCMRTHGRRLAVNWPLVWLAGHRTAKRLVEEGLIGELLEVHFHDGNRGPDHLGPPLADGRLPYAWFHEAQQGGGSLQDYLGYGVTFATWFLEGRLPREVVALDHVPASARVDHRSVTLARYDQGLSTFSTSWSTQADPWERQTLPCCGLTLVGREGTLVSPDYARSLQLHQGQGEAVELPADRLPMPLRDPIHHVLERLERDLPFDTPLDAAWCRHGQRIVDAARRSLAEGQVVHLP